MAPTGTRTQNCFFRVRRSTGLSIPDRDTDYTRMTCSVFICALRSLYSAFNVIPLHKHGYTKPECFEFFLNIILYIIKI